MQIITSTVRDSGTRAERLALTPAAATAVFFWETDNKQSWFWDTVNWICLSISGAALVSDGIVGTAFYFQTGAITTQVDITLPSDTVYLRITPRGTAGTIAKSVINAASVAAATAILAGGASIVADMGYRSVAVGDSVEQQEFFDLDGISLLSLLGAAGVTAVDIMGVRRAN